MTNGCLNCRLLLSSICIFIFLIAIKFKINQKWSHVSWFLIFVPLWIFNLISLCLIGYLILIKKWYRQKEEYLKIIYYSLNLSSLCAFEILLCMKLQHIPDMPYWIVFIPLWIFILLILSIIIQQMYKTCQTPTEKAM